MKTIPLLCLLLIPACGDKESDDSGLQPVDTSDTSGGEDTSAPPWADLGCSPIEEVPHWPQWVSVYYWSEIEALVGPPPWEVTAQYLDEVGWVSADHLIVARADLAAFTVDWGERADCRFLARLDSR